MKKLIIINGTTGVGKTSVGKLLFKSLPHSTFLDGDDVWQINPFVVNEKTTEMVHQNIAFVLRNYLKSDYENIIFVWVLHKQEIIDRLLKDLSELNFELHIFTLIADEKVLLERFKKDSNNSRNETIIINRLKASLKLNTNKIDCTHLTIAEIKDKILAEI